mmetsp:Transcript_43724/g.85577  ORF Transcript_43724/g.85577 Transcript_43724/m.85577 type:complete len:210 (-) Transcript_43724:820-1449(-)
MALAVASAAAFAASTMESFLGPSSGAFESFTCPCGSAAALFACTCTLPPAFPSPVALPPATFFPPLALVLLFRVGFGDLAGLALFVVGALTGERVGFCLVVPLLLGDALALLVEALALFGVVLAVVLALLGDALALYGLPPLIVLPPPAKVFGVGRFRGEEEKVAAPVGLVTRGGGLYFFASWRRWFIAEKSTMEADMALMLATLSPCE